MMELMICEWQDDWDESNGISSDLFDHDIDLISVLHVEVLGGLGFMEALAVEEEADVVDVELDRVSFTLCLWQ